MHVELINKKKIFVFIVAQFDTKQKTNVIHTNFRLNVLEDQMRDPLSIANVDSLLDTVTALVADCDHESIKRLKNIEAYTSRCKLIFENGR